MVEVTAELLSLSQLEIRQICYFLMIVECDNSFSRAAERLHIEQPPLSQRIRALEKRLKVTLFDRRRRPVRLTLAGQTFYQAARLALAQMQRAITQAQQAEKGEIGYLSVGIASSVANSFLPNVLRRFRDRYPHATVALQELTAEQQVLSLEAKQLDVGFEVISPVRLTDSSLAWQVVAEESLVVVVPNDHPLAAVASVSLSALANEALILPNLEAFPFYQQFLDECTAAGFRPPIVQNTTATWMLTILSLVAAGTGLAILPDNVLSLSRSGVVYRTIDDLKLKRQIFAVWRKDNHSSILQNWLDLLPSVVSSS